MICYVLAMGKQHLGPQVVVGYGIKIFWRAFSLCHQITWVVTKERQGKHFAVQQHPIHRE